MEPFGFMYYEGDSITELCQFSSDGCVDDNLVSCIYNSKTMKFGMAYDPTKLKGPVLPDKRLYCKAN